METSATKSIFKTTQFKLFFSEHHRRETNVCPSVTNQKISSEVEVSFWLPDESEQVDLQEKAAVKLTCEEDFSGEVLFGLLDGELSGERFTGDDCSSASKDGGSFVSQDDPGLPLVEDNSNPCDEQSPIVPSVSSSAATVRFTK